MKDLRKLAEEKLNEKVQFKVNDDGVNLPLMLNAIIDAMLSFHEQASKDMVDLKFVEWACFEDSGFEITFNQATNEHGFYSEKLHVFYSLSELYQYYKNNIQGK